VGDFTAFSGCAGESGCFGASAVAPAVALPLFATIFLTDFLLAVGLADKSIFVADGFAESTLTPAVVAASVRGFGVSLGDVESTELAETIAIGVPSGLTKTFRSGSSRAVCETVNALPLPLSTYSGRPAVRSPELIACINSLWTIDQKGAPKDVMVKFGWSARSRPANGLASSVLPASASAAM
jgi:hypothetical protein